MPHPPIRVGIVEDKDDFRTHLAELLNGADGFSCCGAHASAESAIGSNRPRHQPSRLSRAPR